MTRKRRVPPAEGSPPKFRGVDSTEGPNYIEPYDDDMPSNDSNDSNDSMHTAGGDGDVVPANNLRAAAGRGGRTDGSETHVDRIAEVKLRPFHDTQDVIMPYVSRTEKYFTIAASSTATGQSSIAIRLNSIYDTLTVTTFAENPAAAADTADATINKPMLYDYWKSVYAYWTVTKATYKIKFWTGTRDDEGELSLWCYHNGQQAPPLVDAASNIVQDYLRGLHKHCHKKTLRTLATGSTETHAQDNSVTFTGVYYPGNKTVVNPVAEDEFKETWHKFDEVPSQREVVSFIINKSDRSPEKAITVKYYLEIVYHVQLKDLKRHFEYPVGTDDLAAVADFYSCSN